MQHGSWPAFQGASACSLSLSLNKDYYRFYSLHPSPPCMKELPFYFDVQLPPGNICAISPAGYYDTFRENNRSVIILEH
jgi:hypothetical protein